MIKNKIDDEILKKNNDRCMNDYNENSKNDKGEK